MPEIEAQIERMSHEELQKLLQLVQQKLQQREAQSGLSPEQEAELQEEIAAYERDENPGDDWPTVRARILAGRTFQTSSPIEKVAA